MGAREGCTPQPSPQTKQCTSFISSAQGHSQSHCCQFWLCLASLGLVHSCLMLVPRLLCNLPAEHACSRSTLFGSMVASFLGMVVHAPHRMSLLVWEQKFQMLFRDFAFDVHCILTTCLSTHCFEICTVRHSMGFWFR